MENLSVWNYLTTASLGSLCNEGSEWTCFPWLLIIFLNNFTILAQIKPIKYGNFLHFFLIRKKSWEYFLSNSLGNQGEKSRDQGKNKRSGKKNNKYLIIYWLQIISENVLSKCGTFLNNMLKRSKYIKKFETNSNFIF